MSKRLVSCFKASPWSLANCEPRLCTCNIKVVNIKKGASKPSFDIMFYRRIVHEGVVVEELVPATHTHTL